jgi:hypothetical protein
MKKSSFGKNYISFSFAIVGFTILFSGCPGGSGEKEKEANLNYVQHSKKDCVTEVEKKLRQIDTLSLESDYDLYFDFSSTMKRAVSDNVYSNLITTAIDKSNDKTNCYSIGANSALKPIEGDLIAKKRKILDGTSYVETKTFFTANINNIINHKNRPAIVFTDFSIDEGNRTPGLDGITTEFERGAKFKEQFATWFANGGSIRIYGKPSMVNGQKMPIYVIAFLPAAYEESHKVNGILTDLNDNLKEIYFDFHSNFISPETSEKDNYLSDYCQFSMKSNNQKLDNNWGEILVSKSATFQNVVKKSFKELKTSVVDGLSFKLDSSSYIADPEFTLDVKEYKAKDNKKLAEELCESSCKLFKSIVIADANKVQIPLDDKVASQKKNYASSHFYRVAVLVKGTKTNIDKNKITKDLAYNLRSGSKTFLNNCLSESLIQGIENASKQLKEKPFYTYGIFINK